MVISRVYIWVLLLCGLIPFSGIGQGPDQLPGQVFVATNRCVDTLPGGAILFTNQVDTARGLRYLLISEEEGALFARQLPDLETLLDNPGGYGRWAVWVHGDGHSFNHTMERAIEIQALHQVNFIVFSWPTSAPDRGPIGNFKNSLKNIPMSTGHLAELFNVLQAYMSIPGNRIGENDLSVFFHSLGCRLLQQTVEDGLLDSISPGLFTNLVINAAAADAESHASWVEQLDIQERIYIAYNDEDINLEGLRVLSSLGTQLGERPGPPLAKNAIYLDFTGSVGFRFPTGATHSYYYATMTKLSKNIRQLYTDLFQGKEPDLEDTRLFEDLGDRKFGVRF